MSWPIRPALAVLLALLAAPLTGAGTGFAAEAASTPEKSALAALGGNATSAGAGLYRVPVGSGESLLTHGPDPATPATRSARRLARGDEERRPLCAGDYYQHVLVGRLAGTPDRLAGDAGEVRGIIGRVNAQLNADALASGGVNADFKVLCDGDGSLRVDSFESPSTEFSDIVRAARAAGFNAPNADYTIFFDAPSSGDVCGVASFNANERLIADNASNKGSGYGVTYQPCWYGDAPMHEIGHTQGAVQYSAPHSTGTGGHCNQLLDVICYAPDGGDRNQTPPTLDCPEVPRFDCGYDDYFDAAPEPGEYLAGHWNLGSPLNRFIAFGPAEPASVQPLPEPACARAACASRLRLGVPKHGVGDAAARVLYRLRVPAHTPVLRLGVTAPQPLDLWARHEALPGAESACRTKRRAAAETCRIAQPRAGDWLVALSNREAATEFELLATTGRAGRR